MKRGVALTVEELQKVSKLVKKYPSMSADNLGKLAGVSGATVYRIKHGECVIDNGKVVRKDTLERRIERKKTIEEKAVAMKNEEREKESKVKCDIETTKELSTPPRVFTPIATDKKLEEIIKQNTTLIEQNNQIITLLTTLVEVWK